MNRATRRGGLGAAFSSLAGALQWRLLLLWLLATLIPALLVATPFWAALQAQFGTTVHATAIAAGDDLPLLAEGIGQAAEHFAWLGAALGGGTLLMLLVAPWLTGMVIASLRAGRRLGFVELMAGGFSEYWRMLRMMLWSILPLGVALMVGGIVVAAMQKGTEGAILASEVESAGRIGMIVLAVLFVLAHATVEAGRGWLGADPALRSVVRAWWRGLKLLLRRPLATLLVYAVTCIAGFGLAALLAWLRLAVDGVGIGAVVLSFLIGQAIVLAIAYEQMVPLTIACLTLAVALGLGTGADKPVTDWLERLASHKPRALYLNGDVFHYLVAVPKFRTDSARRGDVATGLRTAPPRPLPAPERRGRRRR